MNNFQTGAMNVLDQRIPLRLIQAGESKQLGEMMILMVVLSFFCGFYEGFKGFSMVFSQGLTFLHTEVVNLQLMLKKGARRARSSSILVCLVVFFRAPRLNREARFRGKNGELCAQEGGDGERWVCSPLTAKQKAAK